MVLQKDNTRAYGGMSRYKKTATSTPVLKLQWDGERLAPLGAGQLQRIAVLLSNVALEFLLRGKHHELALQARGLRAKVMGLVEVPLHFFVVPVVHVPVGMAMKELVKDCRLPR